MYDAIVLAGGAARRLQGADKPQLDVGGVRLLDHVLAAVADARRKIVVGPRRAVPVPVLWRREEPPGGGPVAAIAAALDAVRADLVVVLAADLPEIAPAVPALLCRLHNRADVDVACLSDSGGRRNYLAAVWRTAALRRLVGQLTAAHGTPVRLLFENASVVDVPDAAGWGVDCDTWEELADARRRWMSRERTHE
jgi:molybdopterin-guanine dinucleotide biosynthesis protein A